MMAEDLLPDVSDLSRSHLLVLHLDHGEAADSVQEVAVAQEVDGASLLWKLCEGLPPERATASASWQNNRPVAASLLTWLLLVAALSLQHSK